MNNIENEENNIIEDEIGMGSYKKHDKKRKHRPIRTYFDKRKKEYFMIIEGKKKYLDKEPNKTLTMTIKRKRKSGRTRTVQSRKQQIEKMDQEVKLLLESQLKQKEDQLKKLNLEYDESVKNLHENIEQKKSDEQENEELELTKIKTLIDQENNEYQEIMNEYLESNNNLSQYHKTQLTNKQGKEKSEQIQAEIERTLKKNKQELEKQKLDEDKILYDFNVDFIQKQNTIQEQRNKNNDVLKEELENMKKIFKDHDIYEIKKQINELNEQHEDEYDKNKKKEIKQQIKNLKEEKKEKSTENPIVFHEKLKELHKTVEQHNKQQEILFEEYKKYDKDIINKVSKIHFQKEDFDNFIEEQKKFYQIMDKEDLNVITQQMLLHHSQQEKEMKKNHEEEEQQLLDEFNENINDANIQIELANEYGQNMEHENKKIQQEEIKLLDQLKQEELFSADQKKNYENKLMDEEEKYENLIENMENEWGIKYVEDENKLFDEEEQMEHYFLDHIDEIKKKQGTFMILSGIEHQKIKQEEEEKKHMTQKKRIEEIEQHAQEKHQENIGNFEYKEKVLKWVKENYDVPKNYSVINDDYNLYYQNYYKEYKIDKELQKHPDLYEQGDGKTENGLYNYQIDELMKFKEGYLGTFSFSQRDRENIIDMIKDIDQNKIGFIMNTHENNHVHNKHLFHWISIALSKQNRTIYFYDSLNMPQNLKEFGPFLIEISKVLGEEEIIPIHYKLKFHNHEDQPYDTNTCGVYAMLFLDEFFNDELKEDKYETKSLFI